MCDKIFVSIDREGYMSFDDKYKMIRSLSVSDLGYIRFMIQEELGWRLK